MSEHFHFEVPDELDGERLDRCVSRLGDLWTRSQVRRWIDEDRVLRNQDRAKPADRVKSGDLIEVEVPEPRPLDLEAEDIPLSVVYEDEHLLVVDKRAGLVIHPAAGNPKGTLVNALLHYCKDLSGIGGVERPGIVHRLDKDTTGVLVVAKSDAAHLGLSLAFSRREISKTYLAACYGRIAEESFIVDAPIDRHPVDRKKMAVRERGQPARTLVDVVERFAGTSLLACRLITGRTHQIRVHLAHRGHALVGDPLYAGRQWRNQSDPSHLQLCRGFPRQALHAWRLGFKHPVTGEPVETEAPIPADLNQLIEGLRTHSGEG